MFFRWIVQIFRQKITLFQGVFPQKMTLFQDSVITDVWQKKLMGMPPKSGSPAKPCVNIAVTSEMLAQVLQVTLKSPSLGGFTKLQQH